TLGVPMGDQCGQGIVGKRRTNTIMKVIGPPQNEVVVVLVEGNGELVEETLSAEETLERHPVPCVAMFQAHIDCRAKDGRATLLPIRKETVHAVQISL